MDTCNFFTNDGKNNLDENVSSCTYNECKHGVVKLQKKPQNFGDKRK